MKIHILAAILKLNIFEFLFYRFMIVLGVYGYGESLVQKFVWESTFLRLGPSEPPLRTNGSEKWLAY